MAIEMQKIEIKIPKCAISARVIGMMWNDDQGHLESFEISLDDFCKWWNEGEEDG